ncbi:MAG: TetR/AcrR family transcriptional regulator [Calditrichaeota bacterium]|nr:TetR/AcrR family transcriptional regulator [Calditrichota bacterium]
MIGELTPLQKERQNKILQAAAKYFAKVHYHEADMETIARDAGVGKGTLYRYFKNKDDLYLKTIEYLSNQAFEHLHNQAANAQTFKEYVEIIIDTAIDYFIGHPETFSMVLMSNLARIQSVIKAMENVTGHYRSFFVERMLKAIEQKEVRVLKPEIIYSALFAIIIDAVHAIIMRKSGSADEFKQNIKTLILDGLVLQTN